MGGVQAMNRHGLSWEYTPETTPEDLCNAIRGGVLQSIRYMQDKHIAVSVTFGIGIGNARAGWLFASFFGSGC